MEDFFNRLLSIPSDGRMIGVAGEPLITLDQRDYALERVERCATTLTREIQTEKKVILTPYPVLDEILEGGLRVGDVFEIVGRSGIGKTRLCHALVAGYLSRHLLERPVLYVDTSNSFNPDSIRVRLATSAPHPSASLHAQLNAVRCARVFDLIGLLEVLEREYPSSSSSDHHHEVKPSHVVTPELLIVDNIHSLISPLLVGQYNHAASLSSQIPTQLPQRLLDLARRERVCIVLVNGIWGGGGLMNRGLHGVVPAITRWWAYVPHVRLALEPTAPSREEPKTETRTTNDATTFEGRDEVMILIVNSTRHKATCQKSVRLVW